MALYPGAIATFLGFTATHTLAADSHAAQHNSEQAEIIAVETKIGTGSSTPSSGTVLRGTGAGTSAWGQVALSTDITGTLPTANGGTGQNSLTGLAIPSAVLANPVVSGSVTGSAAYVTPTLTTPVIGDYTSATHTHASNAQGGQLNGANALADNSTPGIKLSSYRTRTQTTAGANAISTTDIIQRGTINITVTAADNGSTTLTFPIAFSDTNYTIVATTSNNNSPFDFNVISVTKTTTTVSLLVKCVSGGTGTTTVTVDWIAIGS